MNEMSDTMTEPSPTSSIDAADSALMRREAGEIEPARAARVKSLVKKITEAEAYWDKTFKRIDGDIKFAANLRGEQWDGDTDKYVANLALRHVKDRTAALYAKNPRVRAKRKKRMDFAVWDEKPETLQAAITNMQTAAQMGVPDPNAEATAMMFADIQQALATREMVERVGKTMEILYHYYLDSSTPRFKTQMKGAVRRAIQGGIAWVEMGYQRQFEKTPETIERINDVTERLSRIEALTADIADEKIETDSADAETLRQTLAALQAENDILVEEGLVHTFPSHRDIVLDPRTRQITGFVGTRWLARRYLLTPNQIKEIYKVDLGTQFTAYKAESRAEVAGSETNPTTEESLARVYVYFDKPTGTASVVCEGYPDYLKEPGPPAARMKRFFNLFPIMFNEVEAADPGADIYPQSDVRIIMPQQREHNRSREALRQHRIANQPFYLNLGAKLDDEDLKVIGARVPHAIHTLKVSMVPGMKAEDIIAPMKSVPIDTNLYETNPIFEDIQRTTGSQQANFGGTSGDSATEVSVAAGSNVATLSSAVDDLEETLTELARAGGEVMLLEIAPETAQRIAGPGAAWPEMSREDMADQVYLEIVAGSNGRPNREQDIANLERMIPVIIQVPGFNPAWVARKMAEAIDEGVDLTEALLDGLPSIISMNAASKAAAAPAGTGNDSNPNDPAPKGAPEAQGDQGANNAPAPPGVAPGGQPAFPAPMSGM